MEWSLLWLWLGGTKLFLTCAYLRNAKSWDEPPDMWDPTVSLFFSLSFFSSLSILFVSFDDGRWIPASHDWHLPWPSCACGWCLPRPLPLVVSITAVATTSALSSSYRDQCHLRPVPSSPLFLLACRPTSSHWFLGWVVLTVSSNQTTLSLSHSQSKYNIKGHGVYSTCILNILYLKIRSLLVRITCTHDCLLMNWCKNETMIVAIPCEGILRNDMWRYRCLRWSKHY